ncbi:hypothetical protein NDU88_006511 [Pleurodeles waltl]|uniref:Myb/SANT-like DNA-binding domain-containing protein n=1 Tax=Pleurodeles waltl TaxID=8319 RepID=A0AAV7X3Z3_PLEWA|nr:hypothetical protein NDU88_006511 [Pleurodeles waltl]
MAPPKHSRFTDRELRTMVDEILKVEPQLFGVQVQHTPITREMELRQTIVNKVNAVGNHPRTRDDIRKRWNDQRGKVRSMASRHNIAVQKAGGGPLPKPPDYTDWEEKVLAILHPEGLTGLNGGLDSGILSSQRSILWQKVKREMQRNSDELLHSLSSKIPKAETLNRQKRRFGYLGRRIGYQERGKIPSTHRRFLQSSWCSEEAGYPQSMHHLETVEKAGRIKRYKVASSRLATLLRFCRRPEQSAVDPLAEGEEGDAEEL